MANFDTTKAAIDANIKANGNQEITGAKLQYVLNKMIDDVNQKKQDPLQSGINIKTINGQSILGEGDIPISGGGGGGLATMMTEVTYDALVALRDAGSLIPGMKYRITDYETIVAQNDTQSAGHPFDIIVTALDSKTLDEKASAIHSARDTEGYFADSNLAAWQLMYCLDNDPNKGPAYSLGGEIWNISLEGEVVTLPSVTLEEMVIGDTTYYSIKELYEVFGFHLLVDKKKPEDGDLFFLYQTGVIPEPTQHPDFFVASVIATEAGKGVIYKMIDEHDNEASYDFKNVMFLRKIKDGVLDTENGVDTYCYTLSFADLENSTIRDHSLMIVESLGVACVYENTLESMAFNNVFLSCKLPEYIDGQPIYCHNNFLGFGCQGNTFGSAAYNNRLDAYCSNNVFGKNCYENTLINACHANNFGDDSFRNIFRAVLECVFTEIWASDLHSCNSVTIDGQATNLFMYDCAYMTISSEVISDSKFEYCHSVDFILSGSGGNTAQNYMVRYLNVIEDPIELTPNNGQETHISKNSSGEIKQWCPADLIQ